MALALLTVNVQKDVLSRCSVKDAPAVIDKINTLRDSYNFKVVAHIKTMHSTNHHSFQSSNPGCSLLDKAPGSETRHANSEPLEQKSPTREQENLLLEFDECITKDYCVLGTDGANFSDELPVYDTDIIIEFLDGYPSTAPRVSDKGELHRDDGLLTFPSPARAASNSDLHSLGAKKDRECFLQRIFDDNKITQVFIAGFGLEGTILRTVAAAQHSLGNDIRITVLTDACRSMGNIFNATADQAKVDNMLLRYCTPKESYDIAVPDEFRKKAVPNPKKKKKKGIQCLGWLANNALQESRVTKDMVEVIPPLHQAVSRGKVKEVCEILKIPHPPAASATSAAPDSLHTQENDDELENDKLIMQHDCFGNSAVVAACQASCDPAVASEILAILLSQCSPEVLFLATNTPGWNDMTPLMHAVVQQNHRMVEMLLWKGATVDTHRVAACGKNVLAFALSTVSSDLECAINIANTLITKVLRAHTFEVEDLSSRGVHAFDETDLNNETDLDLENDIAAFAREEQGFAVVSDGAVEDAIASLAALFAQTDTRGWSCIHHAAKTDFLSRLSMVPFGAQPVLRTEPLDPVSEPPSDISTKSTDMMTGVDNINQVTRDGYTPLHIAAWNGCSRSIVALANFKTLVLHKTTATGHTALDLAVQRGHHGCATLLLQLRCSLQKCVTDDNAVELLHQMALMGEASSAVNLLQVDENQIRLSEESLQVLVLMKHIEPPVCTITFADQRKYFDVNPENDPDHVCATTDSKGSTVGQYMSVCMDCDNAVVCVVCKVRCHQGHTLRRLGFRRDLFCSCDKTTCCALEGLHPRDEAGYRYVPKPIDTTTPLEDLQSAESLSGMSPTITALSPTDIAINHRGTDLGRLAFNLARNNHDIWAASRISDGWTYAETRDNENRKHPLLVPFNRLEPKDQLYNIESNAQLLGAIYALDYVVIAPKATVDSSDYRRRMSIKAKPSKPKTEDAVAAKGGMWSPSPVDLSHIHIDENLRHLVELLAQNIHEVWAKEKKKQGWRYAPLGRKQGGDTSLSSSQLVPYEFLSEADKSLQRNTAAESIKAAISLGFKIQMGERAREKIVRALEHRTRRHSKEQQNSNPRIRMSSLRIPTMIRERIQSQQSPTNAKRHLGIMRRKSAHPRLSRPGRMLRVSHSARLKMHHSAEAKLMKPNYGSPGILKEDGPMSRRIAKLMTYQQDLLACCAFYIARRGHEGYRKSPVPLGSDGKSKQTDSLGSKVERRRGAKELLLWLIKQSEVSIYARDRSFGHTALYLAAKQGNEDAVSTLLEAKALPNITDTKGFTPLHIAAYVGNTRCVQLLVAANKKQLVSATDKFGLSALHYATLHGFRDVAEVLAHDLKRAGYDVDFRDMMLVKSATRKLWGSKSYGSHKNNSDPNAEEAPSDSFCSKLCCCCSKKQNQTSEKKRRDSEIARQRRPSFLQHSRARKRWRFAMDKVVGLINESKEKILSETVLEHFDSYNIKKEQFETKFKMDYHPLGYILSPLAAAVIYRQTEIAKLLVSQGANPTAIQSLGTERAGIDTKSDDGMLYARMRDMTSYNLALFLLHELELVLAQLKQLGVKADELTHVNDQIEIAKKMVAILNDSKHTKKLRNTFAFTLFLKRVILDLGLFAAMMYVSRINILSGKAFPFVKQTTDAMKFSLKEVHSVHDWRCWALSGMRGAEDLRQNCGKNANILHNLFVGSMVPGANTSCVKVSFLQHYLSGSIMLRELYTPLVSCREMAEPIVPFQANLLVQGFAEQSQCASDSDINSKILTTFPARHRLMDWMTVSTESRYLAVASSMNASSPSRFYTPLLWDLEHAHISADQRGVYHSGGDGHAWGSDEQANRSAHIISKMSNRAATAKQLEVLFSVYNPSLGIAGTVTTITTVSAVGRTLHSVSVQIASRLMKDPGLITPFLASGLFLAVMLVLFSINARAICHEIRSRRGVGRTGLTKEVLQASVSEIVGMVMPVTMAILEVAMIYLAGSTPIYLEEREKFVDTGLLFTVHEAQRLFISVLAFVLGARLATNFRMIPRFGPAMISVFRVIINLEVIFYVVSAAFLLFIIACACQLVFGSFLPGFSNIPRSFVRSFYFNFGDQKNNFWAESESASLRNRDFAQPLGLQRFPSTFEWGCTYFLSVLHIFFYILMVVIAIILINLFIAIVTNLYWGMKGFQNSRDEKAKAAKNDDQDDEATKEVNLGIRKLAEREWQDIINVEMAQQVYNDFTMAEENNKGRSACNKRIVSFFRSFWSRHPSKLPPANTQGDVMEFIKFNDLVKSKIAPEGILEGEDGYHFWAERYLFANSRQQKSSTSAKKETSRRRRAMPKLRASLEHLVSMGLAPDMEDPGEPDMSDSKIHSLVSIQESKSESDFPIGLRLNHGAANPSMNFAAPQRRDRHSRDTVLSHSKQSGLFSPTPSHSKQRGLFSPTPPRRSFSSFSSASFAVGSSVGATIADHVKRNSLLITRLSEFKISKSMERMVFDQVGPDPDEESHVNDFPSVNRAASPEVSDIPSPLEQREWSSKISPDKKHRPSRLGDVPKLAVDMSKFSAMKSKSAGDGSVDSGDSDDRMRRHTSVMDSQATSPLNLFSLEQKENSDEHEKKESDGKKK